MKQRPSDVTQDAGATSEGTAATALHRTTIDVRWRDLDAFNHVNNANYLTFIEETRLQWLLTLPGPWMDDGAAPVLAASQLNYRRPIQWPARIAVELRVARVGTSSLTLAHRIAAADDAAVVYCDGTTTLVWVDARNGTPTALPVAVRDAGVANSPTSPV